MGLFSKIMKIGSVPAAFIPGVGPFVSMGMNILGGATGGRAAAGLGGAAAGGALAKNLTKPSNEANAALKTLMDLKTKAIEQSQVYGEMTPGLMETFEEGVNRGRFYLDEAGASARQVPGFIQSAEGQYDRAEAALQPSQDYWTNVLKGGPAAMEAIAPEVGAIQGQTNNLMRSVGQFAPRGGGRAATMGELPFEKSKQITNLMSMARREAAAALPQVAQIMTQIGAGRGDLAETQIQLSDMQRRIGATEADIGIAAGRLGIQAGQLSAMLLAVELRGAEAILQFDIKNRQMLYQQVAAATTAGGNIAKTLWDIISDIGGLGGGSPWGTGETVPAIPGTTDDPGYVDWTKQMPGMNLP